MVVFYIYIYIYILINKITCNNIINKFEILNLMNILGNKQIGVLSKYPNSGLY